MVRVLGGRQKLFSSPQRAVQSYSGFRPGFQPLCNQCSSLKQLICLLHGEESSRFLIFQVPNLMSLFRCLDRTGASVQVRGSCKHFITGYVFTMRSCYHLAQPKLEDHPLSAVRDCLFNIFAATLHIEGNSSIRKLRTRHAVVTGTH